VEQAIIMKLAYIAPELGALTSTFIYREITALRDLGAEITPFSTVRPKDAVISEEARSLVAETDYLYEISTVQIAWESILFGLSHPLAVAAGKMRLFHDMIFAKVSTPSDRIKMMWHFMLGCVLARRLRAAGIGHIHAHFAHVATAIAMYGAPMAGATFSFTCHANDIFQRPVALREKTGRAAFTACISQFNVVYLRERGCTEGRLVIVHCAIDVSEYPFRDPKQNVDTPLIFSVGRLVDKKGLVHLINAVAELRSRGVQLQCKIAGNGPLYDSLAARISELGVADSVELMGSQPQEHVRELLRDAAVFALPCVVAPSGDMDGIPVSLMEAMAMGVPVVSGAVSGIPELIESGRNGLLADPTDTQALADALETCLTDEQRRADFATEARHTIETAFEIGQSAKLLVDEFQQVTKSQS
jgi:glycosyltransferase involved in cell wall biosynthesis